MFFTKSRSKPNAPSLHPADQPASTSSSDFNVLVETSGGRMLVNRNDQYIGQSFVKYGEYSHGEIELFEKWVRPDDIVVEVGANVGAFTVAFSRMVGPNGIVLAFEPQRLVFQLLCANLALQQCTNVKAQQQALGRERGVARIPMAEPRAHQNFGGVAVMTQDVPGSATDVVPQEILDNWSIPECRFIKIDVEGMEADVLAGAQATLKRCRPVLYLENDREERHDELVELIEQAGYDIYWHIPPVYRAQPFRGDTSGENALFVSINMLCIPKEMAVRRNEAHALRRYNSREEGLQATWAKQI
jgi:FkbM family methyltransferase